MSARSERNNNPGNIRKSGIAWLGETATDDPAFEAFTTPQMGFRALARVLLAYQEKHGLTTVRAIIARYAPPTENATDSYVDAVAKALNVHPDNDLPELRANPQMFVSLCLAIARHEAGYDPWPRETAVVGVNRALNVVA